MTKILGLYNNKGGVGKTTTAINLATALSAHTTVLLVDADTQCNLTTFYSPAGEDSNEDDGTQPDTAQTPPGGVSVKQDALSSNVPYDLVGDRNYSANPSLFSALLPIYSGDLTAFQRGISPALAPAVRPNIHLLAGSPLIVQFETAIGLSDAMPLQSIAFLGSFRFLVLRLAEVLGANVVLVDFGPSSGILNKVLVMSCDYVMPPTCADSFSLSSADALLRVLLPAWLAWHRQVLINQSSNVNVAMLSEFQQWCLFQSKPPALLPFIVTGYRIYRNQVNRTSSRWISTFEQLVAGPDIAMHVRNLFCPFHGTDMVIPLVPHLGHAIRVSILEIDQASVVKDVNVRPEELLTKANLARLRYGSLATAILALRDR